jgi:hypothetical protein
MDGVEKRIDGWRRVAANGSESEQVGGGRWLSGLEDLGSESQRDHGASVNSTFSQANVFQTVPRFLADYDFLCFPWNHHRPEVRGCFVFLFFFLETARGLLSSGGSPSKQNAATVTVPGRPNYFFRFVASSAHRTKRPVFIKYGPRIATNLQNPSKPTKKKCPPDYSYVVQLPMGAARSRGWPPDLSPTTDFMLLGLNWSNK